MKKISLFLVLVLIMSLCGCTLAANKDEPSFQLSGEEIMAYTSLIKSRIDSKSFLRYDMKIESYNTIRSYVYNLLKNTDQEDRPYLIMFDKLSNKETDDFFEICVIFEKMPLSDIVEKYVINNNNPYTEYIVISGKKYDEATILQKFDAIGSDITFLQRQFEGTNDTYLTIQIAR